MNRPGPDSAPTPSGSGPGRAPAPTAPTEPALRGLFDHAGMFPPAAKALSDALHDAAGFPAALRRPGLVGADLVLAWKDWHAFDGAALAAAGFEGPCHVAVVGVPLANGPEVAAQLAGVADGTRVRIASLEVHTDDAVDVALLRTTVRRASGIPVFLEPKWPAARVREQAVKVAATAWACGAGLKVRCAGPTALDRAALAAAIIAAADAGIPFKATQGLHHPVPRPGFPHGFLNVLTVVRLRQALGEDFDDVDACLADDDVHAFDVKDGIAWRGHRVDAATLGRLPPFAIGSCSLREPDDDLMEAFGPPGTR